MHSSKMILASVSFVIVIASALADTNWCDPALCGTKKHILCNNTGAFSVACGDSPQIIQMTSARIQLLLDTHNKLRNKVALGQQQPFPQAARMQTLKWSNDLALGAEYNTKQCTLRHDKCRNTKQFDWAGQNLAGWSTTGKLISADTVIVNLINSMFTQESKRATLEQIKAYPSVQPSKGIGHFTALIQDKSGDVGCGVSSYIHGKWTNLLLACNYSFNNVMGHHVYANGTAGSKCTTGVNPKYPGLCSDNEVVVPSPYS